MKIDLSVKLGKIKLKNPVLLASGTAGWYKELESFIDLRKLGAILTKTITLNPCSGNPPPRTCETPAGLLNAIGLENPGFEVFAKESLSYLKRFGIPIIVSIAAKDDLEEFVQLAKKLDKIKEVSAIELNLSCPNLIGKKELIAQDKDLTFKVIKNVRKITSKTLLAKLSPNVTSISEIALSAQSAGIDAVSLSNTFSALVVDIERRTPKLKAVSGGLSGPAIRPVALRMVWEVYQKVEIPIVGMGGIIDTSSAIEFFLCGATAVSIGTANFINPKVSLEIIAGLKDYLARKKIKSIKELIGSLII